VIGSSYFRFPHDDARLRVVRGEGGERRTGGRREIGAPALVHQPAFDQAQGGPLPAAAAPPRRPTRLKSDAVHYVLPESLPRISVPRFGPEAGV
jgi:hypothetical protein